MASLREVAFVLSVGEPDRQVTLRGSMDLVVAGGKHSYVFEYELA